MNNSHPTPPRRNLMMSVVLGGSLAGLVAASWHAQQGGNQDVTQPASANTLTALDVCKKEAQAALKNAVTTALAASNAGEDFVLEITPNAFQNRVEKCMADQTPATLALAQCEKAADQALENILRDALVASADGEATDIFFSADTRQNRIAACLEGKRYTPPEAPDFCPVETATQKIIPTGPTAP